MRERATLDAPATLPGEILARLRSESRGEHRAIEQALDLTDAALTREAYAARIQQFYGYYAPIEEQLGAVFSFSEAGPQRKTGLLEEDLRALRLTLAERLPRCQSLPALNGEAEALGCLYVLEGATLGGQVISRHLQATLGIDRESGGRFFHGYGAETGARFRAFGEALSAFGRDEARKDAMVSSAIETFRTFRTWLEKGDRDAR